MKILLLLRHAHAGWQDAGQDYDRKLSERGAGEAQAIGRVLRENDIRPQRILVSAATRAIATVTMATEAAGLEPVIQSSKVLYEKDAGGYLEELRSIDEEPGVVLLVAHNPSLEELLQLLTGHEERLPPAGLARLSLPLTRWSELDGTTRGELTGLWKPGGIGAPKP